MGNESKIARLQDTITRCMKCDRLVAWRELVAREKVRRFADQTYWGRPVPAFGDPKARLLIIGLAPAAHGANRTGRMFTGDRSGDWLFRSLHKFGFATRAEAEHCNDGLELRDCYITAAVHCAPPQNKPTAEEKANCLPYLLEELQLLTEVRVVVVLGKLAFDTLLKSLKKTGGLSKSVALVFSHGAEYSLDEKLRLIASFHPSQQNTFTGKLTEPMFDAVFRRAQTLIGAGD